MSPFEAPKQSKIKKEIKEKENQKSAFKVKDKRSGQDYEVVLDKSGNRQTLNREKKISELENELRGVEKQEMAEKLSQEKAGLVEEIKGLEEKFKKPGIKSEKALIEKSILEKEMKIREIENQLRPAKKEGEDKKEELKKPEEIKPDKSESANTKKEEINWDDNPMIKSEGGVDAPVQEAGAKEEKKTEGVNWDESAVIDAEAGGKKTKKEEDVNWDKSAVINAEKGWDSKKEGGKETLVQKTEAGTAEEGKQNIEKLWQEVEKNRKEYLEKDYSNNKITTRLKNFFGSFLNKGKEGAGFESDKELAEYRAHYDNSLLEHKKATLADAKFKGVSEKEILDIAKFYQVEANVNLADIHDQVKIENQEGKISGFIKEHSRELVERYKKMSLVKKIAIGAAFGLAGAGSIYIGGAAVGIVGSAIVARRMLMGVITGTSVSLGFEAWGKKRTAKKNQAEMKDLEKEMSELSEEEKLKMLEGFINKGIKDEDQKIDKLKNKNLRHLAYGVAAGVAGSGAWSYFMEDVSGGAPKGGGGVGRSAAEEWEEASKEMEEASKELEKVDKEIDDLLNKPSGIADSPGRIVPGAEQMTSEHGKPEQVIPGAEETVPISEQINSDLETPPIESVVVEVQKGDSLWKVIGKQLENHDGYTDLDEAQKTYVVDALKDKVALDPEKFGLDNIDKLKIGQKIDLSEIFQDKQPENLIAQVQDLDEEQMQNILNNNQKLRDWVTANPGEELTSEKTEEILAGEPKGPEKLGMAEEEIAGASEASNIEGAAEVAEISETEEIDEGAKPQEEPEIQFEKTTKEPEITLSAEEAHKMIEKSVDKFGENITSLNTPNFSDGQRAMSWEEIKDVRCSDIQLGRLVAAPEYIKNKLDKIMFFSRESFGAEGIAKPDETLKNWLVRLTEKHGADKIENIFKLAK